MTPCINLAVLVKEKEKPYKLILAFNGKNCHGIAKRTTPKFLVTPKLQPPERNNDSLPRDRVN